MKNTLKCLLFLLCSFSSLNGFGQYKWEWARSMSPIGNGGLTEGFPIALDNIGHLYAGGTSNDSLCTFGSWGYLNPCAGSGCNFSYLVKYDTSGNVIWAKYFQTMQIGLTSIAADTLGNIYIAGIFPSGSLIFGADTLVNTSPLNRNYFLAKLDSDGNAIWARQIDSCGSISWLGSIALDRFGNLFFTGQFQSRVLILGTDNLTNHHHYLGGLDLFVAKFDSSGQVLWGRCAGGTDTTYMGDFSNSVATDILGNVFITGTLHSDLTFFDSTLLTSPYAHGYTRAFVAKYSGSGSLLWVHQFMGSTISGCTTCSGDISSCVAVDIGGNAYVTGGFSSGQFSLGLDTVIKTGSYDDIFVAKLDVAGNVIWLKSFGGTNDDRGYSIGIDNRHQLIWISGKMYSSSAIFGGHVAYSIDSSIGGYGATDGIVIAACDMGGVVQFVTTLPRGGDDWNHIVADANGGVYLCGDYFSIDSSPFIIGSDALPSVSMENFFLAKLEKQKTEVIGTFHEFVPDPPAIFPNPTYNLFTINFNTDLVRGGKVQLYSMTGQLLKTEPLVGRKTIVSTLGLNPGVYACKIITNETEWVNRVEIF